MKLAQVGAVSLSLLCSATFASVGLAQPALRSNQVATAPSTPAQAAHADPDEQAEQPAPVTAVGPGPAAFEPEGNGKAQPAAGAAAPTEPSAPPPGAAGARRFRRWTPEEIARVRDALARQRKQMLSEVHRTPGDPTARFTLGLEISTVYRPDQGFERFELGHWSPRFGIFAAIDIVPLQERLALFAELGAALEHDQSNNLLGAGTSAELSSQTLQLGVGLRWEALPWLSPQVRLSGGASLFQLDVNGASGSFDTGYATSVLGALGAGFILHTPARTFETAEGKLAAFRLGLLVEAGYALRSSIDFSLRTKPDARRIEVIDASLGSLSLSGGYLRFAAVLRF
jgi:hypothetical protein